MKGKLVWMAPFALRDLRKAETEVKAVYATSIICGGVFGRRERAVFFIRGRGCWAVGRRERADFFKGKGGVGRRERSAFFAKERGLLGGGRDQHSS